MMIGQREYELRMQELTWTVIGDIVGCGSSNALYRAQRYADDQGLELKLRPKSIELRNRARKRDAKRWHEMHCGGGMTAPAIAKKDNVTLGIVRKTLQAYRERMWG